jgi:alcohol dehydrogenase YqhD (iron-dependent ADH family)
MSKSALFIKDIGGNNSNIHQFMKGYMWYIHTMEYYLTSKRNKILLHGTTEGTLRTLTHSSQREKIMKC